MKSYNYSSGVDYFGNARALDILGYTTYIHAHGPGYYPMCLHADLAQCAAELEGKESWCIELDSSTYIPCTVYNRGTFVIIGAGAKGIVYYQYCAKALRKPSANKACNAKKFSPLGSLFQGALLCKVPKTCEPYLGLRSL